MKGAIGKALDEEGMAKPERQQKLATLFGAHSPGRPVVVLDRGALPDDAQRTFDRIVEGPIKTGVASARKQLRQSRVEFPDASCNVLFILNNGYTALDHDSLVRLVAHRVRQDTSEIDGVVTASTTGIATPSLEARVGPRLGLRGDVLGAVDLRVGERVRGDKVAFAHLLVIRAHVAAVLAERLRHRRPARQERVQEIRRAAEHAARMIVPVLHHDAAAHQVVARFRLDEG